MELVEEVLPGSFLFRLKRFSDTRGDFVKTFAQSVYDEAGIQFDFREEYYSVSRKDVIRGMHFQRPPADHMKLVYCAIGEVEDVLLDLRKGPGYGRSRGIVLSAGCPEMLVIAKGVAHGFRSMANNSLMIYKTSSEYVPEQDSGVRWDSFGYDWRCASPILSDRDRHHPAFVDFNSPFES